jgi:sulfatase-like protein
MRFRFPRPLVLHPLLFAAFPVLYLFSQNLALADVSDAVRPLLFVVAIAGVLFFLSTLLLRNAMKAGLAVSILVLLFFSYGYVLRATEDVRIGGLAIGRHPFLLPVWALLGAAGIVVAIRAGKRLRGVTSTLNIVAAGLVLINAVTIGVYKVRSGSRGETSELEALVPAVPASASSTDERDIYYIIFDRYGGPDALSEMGFDNSGFLNGLSSKGFYVASESRGNYPKTLLSLASSLNMTYLDFLTREIGTDSDDEGPARRLIKRHTVARFLKSKGYRYIQIGSWWGVTSESPLADLNIKLGGLSEFSSALVETTPLFPVGPAISEQLDFRHREYNRALLQFEKVAEVRKVPGPTFVFAHILVPHGPYVFDQNGAYVEREDEQDRSFRRNYLAQLAFVNKKIDQLVQTLLAGTESEDPIIIFQSDEGPGEAPGDWAKASPTAWRKKFPILNAYYLPGINDSGLYPSISPVNTFREVFNLYFDAGLPILPDRSFIYQDLRHLYKFIDVTSRVRS